MRYLVVGAGALGGYFGGRLLEAGRDVTFLLRPGRAQALARDRPRDQEPLRRRAPCRRRRSCSRKTCDTPFDVVVVACKAYDLAETMASFAPAVGPADGDPAAAERHSATSTSCTQRFGAERVLGGLCMISATLDAAGTVQHLNDFHVLVFGELDGAASARVAAIQADFAGAKFDAPGDVADAARAVGEMGLHRRGGGDHLPDARQHRRHRRRRRGRPERAAARGMPRHRRGQRLRAAAGGDRALPRDHDRGRLADLGVDAEGHRARRTGRGRPRDRRSAAPRAGGGRVARRRRCCASPTPTSRPTRRGGPPPRPEAKRAAPPGRRRRRR